CVIDNISVNSDTCSLRADTCADWSICLLSFCILMYKNTSTYSIQQFLKNHLIGGKEIIMLLPCGWQLFHARRLRVERRSLKRGTSVRFSDIYEVYGDWWRYFWLCRTLCGCLSKIMTTS